MSSNQRTLEQESLADEVWAVYGERWPLPLYTATKDHVWHEFRRRGYETADEIPRFISGVSFDGWYGAEHGEPGEWPYDWKPLDIKYLNFYATDQAYGGPEEGGWYYTVGQPLASVPIRVDSTPEEERASYHELCNRLGYELDRDGHEYRIEEEYGQPFPRERPHYE